MSDWDKEHQQCRDPITCRHNRWPEYDARGIFLTYVCGDCARDKLGGFRPEVLTDPQYAADEPIEEQS